MEFYICRGYFISGAVFIKCTWSTVTIKYIVHIIKYLRNIKILARVCGHTTMLQMGSVCNMDWVPVLLCYGGRPVACTLCTVLYGWFSHLRLPGCSQPSDLLWYQTYPAGNKGSFLQDTSTLWYRCQSARFWTSISSYVLTSRNN